MICLNASKNNKKGSKKEDVSGEYKKKRCIRGQLSRIVAPFSIRDGGESTALLILTS